MRLSHLQRQILIETLARTEQHAASKPPPNWQKIQRGEWDDIAEFGPAYSHRQWFGSLTPAERMRCYRAVRAIEDLGLVEPTRFTASHCRDVLHLKLSIKGEAIAKQLSTESTT